MRNIVVWLVVFVLLVALFNAFQGSVGSSNKNQIAYSDLIENVRNDNVRDLEISGYDVKGHLMDGQEFYSYVPDTSDLLSEAKTTSARVTAVPPEDNTLISILISWFPMLLLIGVWIFFMRQMQSAVGKRHGLRQVARPSC